MFSSLSTFNFLQKSKKRGKKQFNGNYLSSFFDSKNDVVFSLEDNKNLDEICNTNPYIMSIVQYIIRQIFQSGLMIKIKSQMKSYVIGEDEKKGNQMHHLAKMWLEHELIGTMELIFQEWLIYGYACVIRRKSKINKEWDTIHLLPRNDVAAYIKFNSNRIPSYYVIWKTSQHSWKFDNTPIRKSCVLCMYPPTSEGRLQSPIATCIETINEANRAKQYMYAILHRAAELPLIWSTSDNSGARMFTAGPEGIIDSARTSEFIGNGDESMDLIKARMEETAKMNMIRQQTDMYMNRSYMRAEKGGYAFTTPRLIERAEAVDPIIEAFVAPAGHKLENPPVRSLPVDVEKIIQHAERSVYAALGLPPSLDHLISDNAKSVETNNQRQRNIVWYYQNKSKPLFESILALVLKKLALNTIYNIEIDKDETINTDEKRLTEIVSDIWVDLTYNHTPLMTPEALYFQWKVGVISDSAFQELSCVITGIPKKNMRTDFKDFIGYDRDKEDNDSKKHARSEAKPSPKSNTSIDKVDSKSEKKQRTD